MSREVAAILFFVTGICFFTFFTLSYAHDKISSTSASVHVCVSITPELMIKATPSATLTPTCTPTLVTTTVIPTLQNGNTGSTSIVPISISETPIPCTWNTCGWK